MNHHKWKEITDYVCKIPNGKKELNAKLLTIELNDNMLPPPFLDFDSTELPLVHSEPRGCCATLLT